LTIAETSKMKGRPRDQGATRAITDAALDLVQEVGLSAVSIDAIAARAGVGKATIYRRWPSKEDLVVDAIVINLTTAVHLEPTGDLREDLVTTLRRLREFMSDFRAGSIFPWLVGEVASGSDLGRRYAEAVILPRRQALARMISEARDRGELRPDLDIEVAVDMFTGPAFLRKLCGPILPESPGWEEKIVDSLLGGWRR
jgi:AcrR family transcriptional regulator